VPSTIHYAIRTPSLHRPVALSPGVSYSGVGAGCEPLAVARPRPISIWVSMGISISPMGVLSTSCACVRMCSCSQPATQSVNQSVSQPASMPASQSVSEATVVYTSLLIRTWSAKATQMTAATPEAAVQ
jgi:hypothetical protein